MSLFGKNVKKIRGVKKMSQEAFADLFGLKRATLGAYEEGRSEPKIDTIIKVANYFSISIGDILTKEITINQLLSFDGGITTDMNHVVKTSFVKVPFVNEINTENFISDFLNSQTYDSLPYISMPVKPKEGMLAYAVQDLVMVTNEEGLYPGDIVIGMFITPEELEKGDVVIALTDEKMYVRRFTKTEMNYMLLADHINIEPIQVAFDIPVFFWKVSEVLLKRYPNFTSKLEDRIDKIDARLKEISEK